MPRTLTLGILLASLFSTSPSGAATPTLLRDINLVARPISVLSTGAVVGTLFGPRFFTYVSTPETGFELGIIDLSTGALDVVDIEPGPERSSQFGQNFFPLGVVLLFTAHTVEHGQELWVSDGTPEGTRMVADIFPGPNGSNPTEMVDAGNGAAFFAANDGTHGEELWITNGTPGDTLLFADIDSGQGSSSPRDIIMGPNGFLMSACDHSFPVTPGCEPYFLRPFNSAGFLDVLASSLQSAPQEFTTLANPAQAVFSGAVINSNDRELWITDGATVGGTVVLKEIVPGDVGSSPRNLRLVNGVVVFDAVTPENGRELWRTDGTTGGTVLIADVFPGAHEGLASNARRAVVGGTRLVYRATFEDAGAELAVTDGFTVTRLADTMPGPLFGSLSSSSPITATSGKAYAVLADLAHGSELWETDGTPGGTTLVADLLPGPSSSQPILAATRDETVFFFAQGPGGFGLWQRDVGAPSLVRDFSAGGTDTAVLGFGPVAVGGRLFFSAFDSEAGRELWTTDGTPGGTVRLADLHPGFGNGAPFGSMTAMGDRIFFNATDGIHGFELFVSDGTALGTRMLVDIVAGDGSSSPGPQAVLGGRLLFSAFTPGEGFELWASDGTPEGTRLLKDTAPGEASGFPSGIVASGSRAFFSAVQNLWVTDATPDGTTPVDDELFVGSDLLAFGEGSVLFQGITSTNPFDRELWISDGTAAGTRMVKDLVPGTAAGGEPRFLTRAGSRAFFVATTSDGVGLWVTDGTEAGTTLVKAPIAPSADEAGTFGTFEMVPIGDRVVFTLAANAGRSLWVSDGTPAGTLQVSGLCPAGQTCGPSALFAYENVAFFNFDDGTHGLDLWQSDGTPAGTVMVADVVPGTAPFTVERGKFGVLDGKVFFSGCDDTHGCEPWILDFDQCPSDTAKLAPGTCGCGLADLDADASGVVDCLLGSELRARLDALRALIEGLAKPKSRAERRAFKAKIAAILAAFDAAAGYRDANASVFPGLEKPFKKVKKAIKRLRRTRGAKGPRTKALAAVAAVRAAVVAP